MVSLFSRFSSVRGSHRRTQSSLDGREVSSSKSETTAAATATTCVPHGIEVAIEFKPIEHPIEPLDKDTSIQCPLPEPSILNDGGIWKERVSASANAKDGEGKSVETESGGTKQTKAPTKRRILPSMSAPEHNLLKLLEQSEI